MGEQLLTLPSSSSLTKTKPTKSTKMWACLRSFLWQNYSTCASQVSTLFLTTENRNSKADRILKIIIEIIKYELAQLKAASYSSNDNGSYSTSHFGCNAGMINGKPTYTLYSKDDFAYSLFASINITDGTIQFWLIPTKDMLEALPRTYSKRTTPKRKGAQASTSGQKTLLLLRGPPILAGTTGSGLATFSSEENFLSLRETTSKSTTKQTRTLPSASLSMT